MRQAGYAKKPIASTPFSTQHIVTYFHDAGFRLSYLQKKRIQEAALLCASQVFHKDVAGMVAVFSDGIKTSYPFLVE